MVINIFGTGSKGNMYILNHADFPAIMIEIGCNPKNFKFDFNFNLIEFILISHSHGDHAGHIVNFLKEYDAQIITSNQEKKTIFLKNPWIEKNYKDKLFLEENYMGQLKSLKVEMFSVSHDTPDPKGFIITYNDGYKVIYITDTGNTKTFDHLREMENVNLLMIEANYDVELMDKEDFYISRVLSDVGHLSIQDTFSFYKDLKKNNNDMKTLLLHASSRNITKESYKIFDNENNIFIAKNNNKIKI